MSGKRKHKSYLLRNKGRDVSAIFTTKTTGEGTGLGLSLAYDFITKEHSRAIKVESEENGGSKFIIVLPI